MTRRDLKEKEEEERVWDELFVPSLSLPSQPCPGARRLTSHVVQVVVLGGREGEDERSILCCGHSRIVVFEISSRPSVKRDGLPVGIVSSVEGTSVLLDCENEKKKNGDAKESVASFVENEAEGFEVDSTDIRPRRRVPTWLPYPT